VNPRKRRRRPPPERRPELSTKPFDPAAWPTHEPATAQRTLLVLALFGGLILPTEQIGETIAKAAAVAG